MGVRVRLMKKKGLLIVLSGPSGSGKGTICKRFLEKNEAVSLSVSATTRKPREGEEHGVHYFFKTKDEFVEMIEKNHLLEYVHVFDNYYGTPKDYVLKEIELGRDVILEIEIEGAAKVKEAYADAVLVFVLPPSIEELKRRIQGRGTESVEQIEDRLGRSLKEIGCITNYSYFIVNEDVDVAVRELEAIMTAEKDNTRRYLCEIRKEFGL